MVVLGDWLKKKGGPRIRAVDGAASVYEHSGRRKTDRE